MRSRRWIVSSSGGFHHRVHGVRTEFAEKCFYRRDAEFAEKTLRRRVGSGLV
jgi:hypothetical protein